MLDPKVGYELGELGALGDMLFRDSMLRHFAFQVTDGS